MSYQINNQYQAKYHGGMRAVSQIKYLVYHYTANPGSTARNNAVYYTNPNYEASAHYFVDGKSNVIYQSVADNVTAWAVGGNKYNDTQITGGGTLYGVATNYNSISIEMCYDGYEPSEIMLSLAAELGRDLMKKYGITIDRVIRHFDVTGKYCPGWSGWYGKDSRKWNDFKGRLVTGTKTPQVNVQPTNTVVNACYRVKTASGWLPEVKDLTDYAGIQNKPINGLAVRVSEGTVRYRVHLTTGKWMSWVSGCDINDYANGWAGDGKTSIDAIQIYYNTPSTIRPFKCAKYCVSVVNDPSYYDWQIDEEVGNGMDGYAGWFGKPIDLVKLNIV